MDIPNLDYTTKNFIFVKKDGDEKTNKYACPKTIIDSVALIVKKRMDNKHYEVEISKKNCSLLKRMTKFEDEFVEGACKTLI